MRPMADELCVQSSWSVQHLSLDIRPKLFSQIAHQIESERYRALDKPEAGIVEPVRVPQVGEKGGTVGTANSPGGQRFAAFIGVREHGLAQGMSRPAKEPAATRPIVSRVLMQRRIQTESQTVADPGPSHHGAKTLAIGLGALFPLQGRVVCLQDRGIGGVEAY